MAGSDAADPARESDALGRADTDPGSPKPGDPDYDDSPEKTPLPEPVPLGDERSNPGIKSSRGAEVAMVSGEFGAVSRPRETPDERARESSAPPRQPRNGARNSAPLGVSSVVESLNASGRTSRRLASVELDQELSAAAEVVEQATRPRSQLAEVAPRVELAERPAPVLAEPLAAAEPRVSSMIRAAAGPAFARTFVVTVAGATLVGAAFGLLFWWLSAREDGTPAVAPSSAAVVESAGQMARSPIASGSGEMPPPTRPAPVEPAVVPTSSPREVVAPLPAAEAPAAAAPSASSYEELFDEAKRARRRRDFTAVLSYSTLALQQQESAPTLTLQAEALLALGQSDRALAAVESAIALKPRFAQAWYVKGRIHKAMGEIDRARDAFNRYLEIDPEGRRADQVIDLLQDM